MHGQTTLKGSIILYTF